jgi:hypothetical protein
MLLTQSHVGFWGGAQKTPPPKIAKELASRMKSLRQAAAKITVDNHAPAYELVQ